MSDTMRRTDILAMIPNLKARGGGTALAGDIDQFLQTDGYAKYVAWEYEEAKSYNFDGIGSMKDIEDHYNEWKDYKFFCEEPEEFFPNWDCPIRPTKCTRKGAALIIWYLKSQKPDAYVIGDLELDQIEAYAFPDAKPKNARREASNTLASELSRLKGQLSHVPFSDIPFVKRFKLKTAQQNVLRREFRSNLFNSQKRCVLTGAKFGCIASHIKPFVDCLTRDECTSPENGLRLSRSLDFFFDAGHISFEPETGRLVYQYQAKDDLERLLPLQWLNGEKTLNMTKKMKRFMTYHRRNVYGKKHVINE